MSTLSLKVTKSVPFWMRMSSEFMYGTAAKKFGLRLKDPDQQSGTFSVPDTEPLPSPSEQPGTVASRTHAPSAQPTHRPSHLRQPGVTRLKVAGAPARERAAQSVRRRG